MRVGDSIADLMQARRARCDQDEGSIVIDSVLSSDKSTQLVSNRTRSMSKAFAITQLQQPEGLAVRGQRLTVDQRGQESGALHATLAEVRYRHLRHHTLVRNDPGVVKLETS